jgi:hypothetical protein
MDMAEDARRLTKLAEIATVIGLLVAIIGLVVVIREEDGGKEADAGAGGAPVTVQPLNQAASLPPSKDAERPSGKPGEVDRVGSTTRQPPASGPDPTEADTRARIDSPPMRAPDAPAPTAATSPASQFLASRARILVGSWRLAGESCADARQFKITNGVLEVLESNGDMIYSARIAAVDGQIVVVTGGNGGRFRRTGRRLDYVPDSGSAQAFESCCRSGVANILVQRPGIRCRS